MKSDYSKDKLITAKLRLAVCNWFLNSVMNSDESLTDKEYNSIREAHDYIASAHDIIERLTKQD
jgi:hypothetical protein